MECFLDVNQIYMDSKLKRTKECNELKPPKGKGQTAVKIVKHIGDLLERISSLTVIQSVEDIGELVDLLIQLNETFDPNLDVKEFYMCHLKSHVDSLVNRLCVLFDQVMQYSNQIQILPGLTHHYVQTTINLVIQFLSDMFDSHRRLESEIKDDTLEKLISTFIPCYHYSLVQGRCKTLITTSLSFHSIFIFMNHYILAPISPQRPSLFDPTTVCCILLKILRTFKSFTYEPVPKKNNLWIDPFLHCAKELVERYLNHLLTCRPTYLERNIAFDELFFQFYLTFEAYDYESQLPNGMKTFLLEIFNRQNTKAWNHFVLIDRECKNDQSVQLIKFLKESGFKRSYAKPEGEERSPSKSVIERTTRRTNRQMSTNNNGTVNGKRKRSQ